jgi:multisubunit Na+/H+ antiporter MnhG subunit
MSHVQAGHETAKISSGSLCALILSSGGSFMDWTFFLRSRPFVTFFFFLLMTPVPLILMTRVFAAFMHGTGVFVRVI